ncbi:hypothetical protein FB451DRAFT_1389295 [Mycena latifolia]|nr:hypothetical protein FB451DRAFT_1389295 [Mycena latifolia]
MPPKFGKFGNRRIRPAPARPGTFPRHSFPIRNSGIESDSIFATIASGSRFSTRPRRRADSPSAKRVRVSRYKNCVPEEEAIRNDYSQRYVDGGEWPQNWVLGADPDHCFEEYPKQQRLLVLEKASANTNAVAPSYLPVAELASLHPAKFEVILLDPVLHLGAPPGAANPRARRRPELHLHVGRQRRESGCEVLARWGYRHCEDVVWVRTKKTTNRRPGTDALTTSRRKQPCLTGIRRTVRWEGDVADPTRKPPDLYTLIENFSLGMRRREVFGRARSSLRRGWEGPMGMGYGFGGGQQQWGAGSAFEGY